MIDKGLSCEIVNHLAIDLSGKCRLGKARTNGCCHFGNCDRTRVVAFGTVRKRDLNHLE
jgi:hypothetical protein